MMKKLISVLLVALFTSTVFAATLSYKNNTYQKLADEYTRKAILYNEQEIEVKSGNTRETQKRITLQVPKVYEKISVRVNSGTTQVNSSSQNENYYIYIIDVNTSSTIFVEYSFDGNTLKETYNVSV